jgi:hypothetical protein
LGNSGNYIDEGCEAAKPRTQAARATDPQIGDISRTGSIMKEIDNNKVMFISLWKRPILGLAKKFLKL